MHRSCLPVIVLILGSCTHYRGAPALVATPEYLDRLSVELVASTEDGQIAPYCSGTWIGPHEILTASHCMDGAASLSGEDLFATADLGLVVQYALKSEPNFARPGVLIRLDRDHDLALVRTMGRSDVAARLGSAPQAGDAIYTDGHHYGLGWSYTKGSVSAVRVQDGPSPYVVKCKVLQLDIDDGPGDSGSGVFDTEGRLVGVASYKVRGASVVFAIHRDAVEDFLGAKS